MRVKKIKVAKQLLIVVWIPNLETKPLTVDEVLKVGGRIVDKNLSKIGAEEVERCLNIGTEGLDGEYITVY
ncbi:hypothetical protein [Psychromonas ossibalaenae]|uniref:hypothetical protein n=1 Tax=Psychromonas ossibalaenae TaxID=444922 RepID=UPI00037E141C|nr:hypothetical protein [Psychromonas ossibalaenae]